MPRRKTKKISGLGKLKYIDIFAGCGGLSVGFYNSGRWQGLFGIESDKDAFASLQHNLVDKRTHFSWPKWLPLGPHDINAVISSHRSQLIALKGKVDLVAGGPPCQGFSVAGRRREHDKRNTLVHSYLEFISLVRPKALLFENVKGFAIGFVKSNGGRGSPYSVAVLEGLKAMGYLDATFKVVKFSALGIPQRRERFILVATLSGNAERFFTRLDAKKNSFLAKRNISVPVTVRQAISDLEKKHGVAPSPDSDHFHAGVYRTGRTSNYQTSLRPSSVSPAMIPDSHRFARHGVATSTKYRDVIKRGLSPKEIRADYPTKKSCTLLLQGNKVGPTLTTLPDDFIHYSEPRILSPREYARLQSFPDWVEFKGPYTTGGKERRRRVPRYSQIGNAIPPLFAEQAANVIAEMLLQPRT